MIPDANRYYGAAICSIVDLLYIPVKIQKIDNKISGFYMLNELIPIFIKYSTQRKGPWIFNYKDDHQREQENLYQEYGECIMIFVCGKDGIAALVHNDFRKVLADMFDVQGSVAIRRKHNEMYRITGRDGKLEKRVARNSLREILVPFIKSVGQPTS